MRKIIICAVLVMSLTAATAFAEQPIKLGFLFVLSGPAASFGTVGKQGVELALEEINKGGGVAGRKIEAIFEDSKGNKEGAIAGIERLVKVEKVDGVIGVTMTSEAIAVTPAAKNLKIPLIVTTAFADEVTGKDCNRYVFRIGEHNRGNSKVCALVAEKANVRKWTYLGPDYELGREAWNNFQKFVKVRKADTQFASGTDVIFAPISTTDWVPHIQQMIKSDADGIYITLFGANLLEFVRQGRSLGLFDGKRQVLVMAMTMDVAAPMGATMPIGLWISPAGYWFQAYSTPENEAFVKAYTDKYHFPPGQQALFGYVGVNVYAEAVKKAGSTEKEAVVNALEGLSVESPVGKIFIRPDDHQALFQRVAGRTGKSVYAGPPTSRGSRASIRSLEPIFHFSAQDVAIPIEETGCKMK